MLIVGLGNPGERYQNTFHNMGFMALDALAERLGKKIKKAECDALTATFTLAGNTVVLAKPQTFMNLSGISVKGLLKKYKFGTEELIVLFDDFDLPRFTVRARKSGSGGTHNGMKNIIEELKTTDFKRVRFGIGKSLSPLADYVLSPLPVAERPLFQSVFDFTAAALEQYLRSPQDERAFDALMRACASVLPQS